MKEPYSCSAEVRYADGSVGVKVWTRATVEGIHRLARAIKDKEGVPMQGMQPFMILKFLEIKEVQS